MNALRPALLLVTASVLTGCATSCSAWTDVNMVVLNSATDARTGASIPSVQITAASIDGQDALSTTPYNGPRLIQEGHNGAARNVRFEGGQVICDLGCVFGPPGSYRLTVSAPGYQPQTLTFTVARRNVESGLFGIPYGCGGKFTGTPQTFDLKFTPSS